MKFCSVGSGSKGNATLVQSESTTLMIDCGFTLKQTMMRIDAAGIKPEQIDAVLVTHEHSDHISGVSRFAKKFGIPVYLTHGTAQSKKFQPVIKHHCIKPDQAFSVGDFQINPVTVPHDAREPCQFIITDKHASLGILTDLGCISPHVKTLFSQCNALVLEANHDIDQLMSGVYPPSVKQRVASDWGHLSNDQALQFLQTVAADLDTVVLAHISEKNNSFEKVEDMFSCFKKEIRHLQYATQEKGYDWLVI